MKEPQYPQITYQAAEKTVVVMDPEATILDISLKNKVPHLRECGGNGRCTTCRVRILDGLSHVTPRTLAEQRIARIRNWDESIRLACQAHVTGDIVIQRLIRTVSEISGLQIESLSSGPGKEAPLAILFCDMRNFTPFVEQNPAFDVVHMLNRFFTALGEPILMNNGVIYQYVGDEIIGLFGLEGGDPEQLCLGAIRAGLGMVHALEELNTTLGKEFDTRFSIGVGIHFGNTIIGHIGHPSHRQFGVIGDPVNVASRIQSQNKELGTNLLISEEVFAKIQENSLNLGKSSTVMLKGKTESIPLFEVLGFAEADAILQVQNTVLDLLEEKTDLASHFYQTLFAAHPELMSLFSSDLTAQKRMLTHMLRGLVYALGRPEHLRMGLRKLGQQHVLYGVKRAHYPMVENALLTAIGEKLSTRQSLEGKAAWKEILRTVLSMMQEGLPPD